jgi:cytochrome c
VRRRLAWVALAASALWSTRTVAATAVADPGERAFRYCISCHSVDPAETNLPGPNLFGVVGRPIASLPGFRYTGALKDFAHAQKVWTAGLIEQFIMRPQDLVPGTAMQPLPGMKDPRRRRALLDYLSKHR